MREVDEEPLPLVRHLPPAVEFPVDALGALKPAAEAICARSQAPMAICANAVIASVALAGQAHVDVMLPIGQVRPISVNILTIARSGERKTTVDYYLASYPVKQQQSELREAYRKEIARFVAEHKAWEGQTRKITNDKKLGYTEQIQKISHLRSRAVGPA